MPKILDNKDKLTKSDIAKFCVLIAFVALSIAAVVYFWPWFRQLATDEGRSALIDAVKSAGPWGVCIMLAIQLVQVIIAAIPGEGVQIVAGLIYGPVWGSVIILIGALLSTMFVYFIVRKLGTPFVNKIVPADTQEKLAFVAKTNKMDILVFVLFLIPGLPKDFLTYIIALTEVRPRRFFALSTLGRVPGVVASSFIGSSFAQGNWIMLIVLISAALAVLGLCAWKREEIMHLVERFSKSEKSEPTANSATFEDTESPDERNAQGESE